MKKVRVILSVEAEKVYKYLNANAPVSKTEKTLLKAVNDKIELIKNNIHYGEPIAKKKIPTNYIKNYGVNNLFRVELPNHWRMLYTLTNGESQVEIITFIIDLIDHKDYNKKFGYKKK